MGLNDKKIIITWIFSLIMVRAAQLLKAMIGKTTTFFVLAGLSRRRKWMNWPEENEKEWSYVTSPQKLEKIYKKNGTLFKQNKNTSEWVNSLLLYNLYTEAVVSRASRLSGGETKKNKASLAGVCVWMEIN